MNMNNKEMFQDAKYGESPRKGLFFISMLKYGGV